MTRPIRIYTRTGDQGMTGLGDGQRVSKSSPRVAAYGAVDELNAQLGVVLAGNPATEIGTALGRIQRDLFSIGAELCCPHPDAADASHIGAGDVERLESLIDTLANSLTPLRNFILPGGSATAAQLHVARTVCRRAEREVVGLSENEAVSGAIVTYLNRLSDLLFVMARFQNHTEKTAESEWRGGSPAEPQA